MQEGDSASFLFEPEDIDDGVLPQMDAAVVPPQRLLAMSVQQQQPGSLQHAGAPVEAVWGHVDKDPKNPERSWRGVVVDVSKEGLATVLYDDADVEYYKSPSRVWRAHGETKAARALLGELAPGQLQVVLRAQYHLAMSRVRALRAACELTGMTVASACASVDLAKDGHAWPLAGMPGGPGAQLWVVERDWTSAARAAVEPHQRAAADRLLACVRDAAWRQALLAADDATTMADACAMVTDAVQPVLVELVLGSIVNEGWRVQTVRSGDAPDVQLFVEALRGVRGAPCIACHIRAVPWYTHPGLTPHTYTQLVTGRRPSLAAPAGAALCGLLGHIARSGHAGCAARRGGVEQGGGPGHAAASPLARLGQRRADRGASRVPRRGRELGRPCCYARARSGSEACRHGLGGRKEDTLPRGDHIRAARDVLQPGGACGCAVGRQRAVGGGGGCRQAALCR
jgi:hypothetical protein